MGEKIRTFLAFEISDEMRRELSFIIEYLSPKVKGIKWVDLNLMHCTLSFFGDVDEDMVQGKLASVIEKELRHQSPFKLSGRGVGVFPNWRYPKVLWAGLHGDTDAVISLHAKLEDAFEEFGFKQDKRKLRLHLTLGRAKSKFKEAKVLVNRVEKMGEKEYGNLFVDSLVLFKSDLTKDGPVYTELKRFSLGGKRSGATKTGDERS